jgi:hypothetical protein
MYEYGAIGTMSSVWCGVGLEPDPSRCRIPEVERRMEGSGGVLIDSHHTAEQNYFDFTLLHFS